MKHVTNEQYWKAVEYRSIISGIFTLLQNNTANHSRCARLT